MDHLDEDREAVFERRGPTPYTLHTPYTDTLHSEPCSSGCLQWISTLALRTISTKTVRPFSSARLCPPLHPSPTYTVLPIWEYMGYGDIWAHMGIHGQIYGDRWADIWAMDVGFGGHHLVEEGEAVFERRGRPPQQPVYLEALTFVASNV